jgi:hypothetical protein
MVNRIGGLQALRHTLDALEQELLDASDEEVLAAAAELRLNPDMQGSIALAGVTQLVPAVRQRQADDAAARPSRRRRGAVLRPPKQ